MKINIKLAIIVLIALITISSSIYFIENNEIENEPTSIPLRLKFHSQAGNINLSYWFNNETEANNLTIDRFSEAVILYHNLTSGNNVFHLQYSYTEGHEAKKTYAFNIVDQDMTLEVFFGSFVNIYYYSS